MEYMAIPVPKELTIAKASHLSEIKKQTKGWDGKNRRHSHRIGEATVVSQAVNAAHHLLGSFC